MNSEGLSRRHALTGAATVGLGLPLLAACGGSDSASDASSSSGDSSGPSASSGAGAAAGLTTTADIPVGGGAIFPDDKVVVTQPTAGDFKAFSAVCTHQSCLVAEVTDGEIDCTCHGSKFSIEDGSVQAGPAPSPLAAVDITVKGDQISLA